MKENSNASKLVKFCQLSEIHQISDNPGENQVLSQKESNGQSEGAPVLDDKINENKSQLSQSTVLGS